MRFGRLHLLVRQGRRDEAEELLAELGTNFGAYDYTAGVCAAWEAELALWDRDWSRARHVLGRADAITAATDEVMLELRLTALAMRLHADEYDVARTSATPRDVSEIRRVADARLQRAEVFLERIEKAVDARSAPFHQAFELARAERSRLDDRPPAEPWADLAVRAGSDSYLAAYANWRQAAALLTGESRNSRPAAGDLLRGAATAAQALGAQPLETEIADLARRAGTDLRNVWRDGDTDGDPVAELVARGLTSREVEVLRLLGEGRSNREIGEALFISAKTASVHVTHILQKLNVASRVQAAVAAHRLVQPPAE